MWRMEIYTIIEYIPTRMAMSMTYKEIPKIMLAAYPTGVINLKCTENIIILLALLKRHFYPCCIMTNTWVIL